MEMHQVRYFLAVARTLNFTRAAEQCNVSQPALTRAIRQLEEELCGELLRREGKLSHLTDLGLRMQPLLQQCYDSALAAKSIASSYKKGANQALSVALSQTIDIGLLVACLAELQRAFAGLQLKVVRGNAAEIGEALKKGQAELAIAGPLGEEWERLDSRPLFEEQLLLAVHRDHKLAGRDRIDAKKVGQEPILLNAACETAETTAQLLGEHGIDVSDAHRVGSQHDLIALAGAKLGAAFLPQSALAGTALQGRPIEGIEMSREVSLYTVAGRPRTPAGDALMKLLRARDWSDSLR